MTQSQITWCWSSTFSHVSTRTLQHFNLPFCMSSAWVDLEQDRRYGTHYCHRDFYSQQDTSASTFGRGHAAIGRSVCYTAPSKDDSTMEGLLVKHRENSRRMQYMVVWLTWLIRECLGSWWQDVGGFLWIRVQEHHFCYSSWGLFFEIYSILDLGGGCLLNLWVNYIACSYMTRPGKSGRSRVIIIGKLNDNMWMRTIH